MNYFQEFEKSLANLIKIPSVQQDPLPGKPFGAPAAEALSFTLDLAEKMGFTVKNYDNYVGEVIFGDENVKKEDCLAVLCHLDVVPEGSGWTVPPFALTIKDGKYYGRGVVDDKGPALLTLYAMKKLKDEGFFPEKTIKLILGCNEESGWGCIDHYNEVAEMPDEGFSPDADFPVIYAEKGIYHVEMTFDKPEGVVSFTAGDRPNMVPGFAELTLARPISAEIVKKYGLTQKGNVLSSVGMQAHGSHPEDGKNATLPLVFALRDAGEDVGKLLALFADQANLSEISDETGKTTFSPDVFRTEGNELRVTVDIRYSATHEAEEIAEKLKVYGVPCRVLSLQPPLFNDKNGFMIRTLCDIYNRYMGCKTEPIAIGGGTYARALKLGAAFGPEFPGETPVAHQADECAKIANYEKVFGMYYEAVKILSSRRA